MWFDSFVGFAQCHEWDQMINLGRFVKYKVLYLARLLAKDHSLDLCFEKGLPTGVKPHLMECRICRSICVSQSSSIYFIAFNASSSFTFCSEGSNDLV